MDLWSMTGAGTQAFIEFTALIIEIVAIVVIIEWLRKRREDRLLEGVRRHIGDEIIHDIRKLIRSLAILAGAKTLVLGKTIRLEHSMLPLKSFDS